MEVPFEDETVRGALDSR